MKTSLTIAGSDSSGGAGIQADLKTFSALGTYGMSVITAVTAQNTRGVLSVQDISPNIIEDQLDAIFTDIKVDSVKIGMLSTVETIKVVAKKLKEYNASHVVLDPVMISKSGYDLLHPEAVEALKEELLPLASVVTPNVPEACKLTGAEIKTIEEMEDAARLLIKEGPSAILMKGGHLEEEPTDILFDGEAFTHFYGKRIQTKNTHGTGCTLSAAISAGLARGLVLEDAVKQAKEYITGAIKNSLNIGSGHGPTHHFYDLYEKAGVYKGEEFKI
ncbi:bifunctional hydroxymethylpyrimidine kinase/phosphomethylpyrimidine kinase [Priestia endophytica]|uniref:bifunctional hydroxymethylpyrimidine kinase/phosphomethylpyrimidine kinase n=1 Tax=Priestia endophytica TaxID=135735 RepID=UPI002E240710|nr:bifunctional hydroxymethylpyrimidine kinase/phosphomethylpyrimidine kinase [Priestia endophytica]MED4074343.1 bifunctional hydroxymethylpyrimidine kinase/phosphomethylpyrimidine kinase [Priestia endophytica]